MNWLVPNTDQYIMYFIQAVTDWSTTNLITISIVINILQWLKKKAIQSPSTKDDAIITFLLGLFSFDWLRKLAAGVSWPTAPEDKKTSKNGSEVETVEKVPFSE